MKWRFILIPILLMSLIGVCYGENVTVELPNLNITDISIGTPLYRINTLINVTITNNGDKDINTSFSVDLYADANKISSITLDGLKVGENKTLIFSWIPERVRKYTIVAVVDPGNVVSEKNEDDNKVVKKVVVTEKPIEIEIDPSALITDSKDTFTVDIYLSNVDHRRPVKGIEGVLTYDPQVLNCTNFVFLIDATAGLKDITFERGKVIFKIVDGAVYKPSPIARATFKAISTGTSKIGLKDINVSDTKGYLFNSIAVDPATVTVKGPNLNIDISIGTPLYRINTPINITITNNGHMDTNRNRSFVVELYADTDKIGSVTVNGLEVGEKKTVTFHWIPERIKEHTLVAVVDRDNSISEEKEDDNKVVKTVKVLPITTYAKMYRISQDSSTLRVTIDVLNVPKERPVGGYDIYIKLKNLSVLSVNPAGKYAWDLSNDTLFITAFNISKSGKFSIANITFNIIHPTYSAILYKVVLSDTDGYPFQKIILENEIPIAEDIKSEKIKNFTSKAKIIVGSEIDASLSAVNLNTFILVNRPLEINKDSIFIGGPVANPVVRKYLNYFPVRVTNEYPGWYRGVIEVIKIGGHTVVLLAGSDRWGTKAAVEYFKTLEDLPDEPIFVEWRNGEAVKIEGP